MAGKRNFSVVLHDHAVSDLRGVLSPWLKSNDLVGSYLNCKTVDPNGPYFHMVIQYPEGSLDFEVQIPHSAVKAIVCTTDLKKLGYVQNSQFTHAEPPTGSAYFRRQVPMTHSIDFKGIEEKLFLIQKVVLGSRAYCEERDIGRSVGRYGEAAWSDYSFQLQELISSYAIECAIKTRMVQDLIAASDDGIDLADADAEARDGFEIGVVHRGSFDLTVRESCNKIIHATKVELDWSSANLRKAKKKIEYWNGGYHLHGSKGKAEWHLELDMQRWAVAVENFHAILDEQVNWEKVYGL